MNDLEFSILANVWEIIHDVYPDNVPTKVDKTFPSIMIYSADNPSDWCNEWRAVIGSVYINDASIHINSGIANISADIMFADPEFKQKVLDAASNIIKNTTALTSDIVKDITSGLQ